MVNNNPQNFLQDYALDHGYHLFFAEDSPPSARAFGDNVSGEPDAASYGDAACERARLAFSASKDGIWDWYPAHDTVVCSPEYFSMLGYPAVEAVIDFEGWLGLLHPEDRENAESIALACKAGEISDFVLEIRLKGGDGLWRWILSRGRCVNQDEEGKPSRIIGTHTSLSDATAAANNALRTALREKELLLKEVHHRIKNNMAMVQSMLSVQADRLERSPEAKDALQAAAGRVHSMMALYARIYEGDVSRDLPLDVFISDIVDDILANAIDARHIRVQKRIEPLPISPKCISTIGIVFNELITNAIKHAFPDGRQGTIELDGYAEGGKIRLSVRDDGEGLGTGQFRKGFGLLMAQSLVEQLGGRLRHESAAGTRFSFELDQASCR